MLGNPHHDRPDGHGHRRGAPRHRRATGPTRAADVHHRFRPAQSVLRGAMPAAASAEERDAVRFLRATPGSGIIYASTPEEDRRGGRDRSASRPAAAAAVYHAGLLPDDAAQAQEAFMTGRGRDRRRHQRLRHGHRQGRRPFRRPLQLARQPGGLLPGGGPGGPRRAALALPDALSRLATATSRSTSSRTPIPAAKPWPQVYEFLRRLRTTRSS